jgi:amidase
MFGSGAIFPRVLLAATMSLLLAAAAPACDAGGKAGGVELGTATAAELQAALTQRRVTSAQLVRAYLARIAACDAALHAIIATNPAALREARRLDAERAAGRVRGPLHGVPVVLKDNIDLAGMATTAGSLALAANLRERSAPLVDKLLAAGAVVIAKANLSEWANIRSSNSSSGWSAVGGLAVNPRDARRTACGSSSGSATAVVARFAPVAVGTETNGSIVCPASINGLVGLKPTVGLVSGAGVVPISHSQDTAGPMTASVADAALLLSALQTRGDAAPDYRAALRADALAGTRLGVVRFIEGYSPATRRVFEEALALLREQGAELVEIDKFDMTELRRLQLPILLTELKADLDAYLATTPPGVKTRTLADVIAFNRAEPRELVHFGQELFEQAQATRGLDDPEYVEQLRRAKALSGALGIDKLLREHDVAALIAPTAGPAWTIDLINGDRSTGSASTLAAMSGYPHLTVPMGDVAGMPIGLSFFGRAWDEQTLLSLGHSFERARMAASRPARVSPTSR